jgi:hypothetical protein
MNDTDRLYYSLSPYQEMILRFWGIAASPQTSISDAKKLIDQLYSDPDRRTAWEIWKLEAWGPAGPTGRDPREVPFALGPDMLCRIKANPELYREQLRITDLRMTPRQQMVFRFFGITSPISRREARQWIGENFAADPDRPKAWSLWKEEHADVYAAEKPACVPFGAVEQFRQRVREQARHRLDPERSYPIDPVIFRSALEAIKKK